MADIVTRELCEAIRHNHLFVHEELVKKKSTFFAYNFRECSKNHLQAGKFSSIMHMSEGTAPVQIDPVGPPVATYTAQLVAPGCETRTEFIHFWKEPKNGIDVKEQVQLIMNIPVSTITLRYNGKIILDPTLLASVGVANRDTLEVQYDSEADIEEVYAGYRWFDYIHRLSTGRRCSVWTGLPAELEYIITAGLREDLPHKLSEMLCGEHRRVVANREYFEQIDGTRTVHLLHETLCLDDWRCLPMSLKMVEVGCMQVLAAMTRGFTVNTCLARLDIVGFVVRSLMRAKVRRGSKVTDASGGQGNQEHKDLLMTELVKACLEFMIGIQDRKPLQEEVISNSAFLDQLINLLHSPSITTVEAQNIICVIGGALWCVDGRRWITNKSYILEWISEAVKARRKIDSDNENEKELILFEFLVQTLLSSVVLTATFQISRRLYDKLLHHLEGFLARVTPTDVSSDRDLFNGSPLGLYPIKNALKLLYPYQNESVDKKHYKDDIPMLDHLRELSMESVVFLLQVLQRACSSEVLREVKFFVLTDFIVCLQSYVPAGLKEKSKKLARTMFSNDPIPIPSLEGMARVFLAKYYFGLQNILGRNVEDISVGVRPSSKNLDLPHIKAKPQTPLYLVKLPG